MILTDYYKGVRLNEATAKYRFEILRATFKYNPFQLLLINKGKPNPGGMSFNFVPRPQKWKGEESPDMAITKGSVNISSVHIPDPAKPFAYGDINGTKDACLMVFNADYREKGITCIELFISRGQKLNRKNLWYELVDGELDHEIEMIRALAIDSELNF